MEAPRPRGGGLSHASPPEAGNVASRLAETLDMPDTQTPTRWRPRDVMQSMLSDSSAGMISTDEDDGQESWQPGGSNKTPSRASEVKSGIKLRKASQKTRIGKPKHQTSLLDASKHAQVLVGALESAQAQQQEVYQMVLGQVQTHLAEELSNWRAEQQIHEGVYLDLITNLELEVSKLRTELTEAQHIIQRMGPVRQNTPANSAPLSQTNQHDSNQVPKTREITGRQSRQKPTFADLAALLSTKPGGQEWQEVTQKRRKHPKTKEAPAASRPDPTKIKPVKDRSEEHT